MKFCLKLNLILETSNKKLAWGDKEDWELIFGGYDVQDTYDLIPITKDAFPSNISYESIFGHITSIKELSNLMENQNQENNPISTFKNFERNFMTMPSGGGTLTVLKGQPLFGSDMDTSSIPGKEGINRYINSGQFTSEDRFIDENGFPKDFLDHKEYLKLTEFKDENVKIKSNILKQHLGKIKKIITALKAKKKKDETYDKYDFQIYSDPHDFSFIREFEYFNIVNKVLPETPDFEFNGTPYTMEHFDELKEQMTSTYFNKLKKYSANFWKDNDELLSKVLLPKKIGFKITSIVDWNEFIVKNYTIQKIYFFDFIEYYTDKRQDASLLKEALELLINFLKNSNLKSKVIIEEFSNFPIKEATKKNLKTIQEECSELIKKIKIEHKDIILSKSDFKKIVKQELERINKAEIKIDNN